MQYGKVVIAGGPSTGKTSIIRRYIDKVFNESVETTLNADFYRSDFAIDNKPVHLSIWDTAGQEKFSSVSPVYFRGAQFAIIVFDVASKNSLEAATYWINQVRLKSQVQTKIVLVANKIDMQWVIAKPEVQNFAADNKMEMMETSAKTGHGVKELFQYIGREYISAQQAQGTPTTINFNQPKAAAKEEGGCC